MRETLLFVTLIALTGCAGAAAGLLGAAAESSVEALQAANAELASRLDAVDGSWTRLSGGDWGAIGGSLLGGLIGLNRYRNGTRKRAIGGGKRAIGGGKQ